MKIRFVVVAVLCLLGQYASAQKAYPINVVTQVAPPHSGLLSDMVAPGFNKLAVTLILNDANEVSYQTRLRLTIEGPGILIQTNPNAIFSPISLGYAVPKQLISADLAPYLDLNNLVFSGISKQEYLELGGLPDGLYNFCFEAVDFDRFDEDPASSKSCALINAVVNDPPVILSPIGSAFTSDPQQLPVQWQAMHTGTFPTVYDVEVYEYPENSTLTLDQLFDFQQPFFEREVMGATTTVISAADPPLNRGARYVMRVRARDVTERNFFKNQGWSEYKEFYYGEACEAPLGFQLISSDVVSATFNWTPVAGFATYVVRYRNASIPGSPWYEDETNLIQHTVEGLTIGASYEFQVQSLCGGSTPSDWSSSVNLLIEDPLGSAGDFECGDIPSVPRPNALYPIANLNLGDVIRIGHFDCILTSVTKNDNTYEGKGKIYVPWLSRSIKVSFDAIKVNVERIVFEGTIEADSKIERKTVEPLDSAGIAEDFSFCEMAPNPLLDSTSQGSAADSLANATPPADTSALAQQGGTNPTDTSASSGPSIAGSSMFSDLDGSVLPIGVKSSENDTKYSVYIQQMTFHPKKAATLDAVMRATIPGINRVMPFRSKGTAFHPGGMSGEQRLMLPGTISVPLQGKFRLNIIAHNNRTYVSWDCNGFKQFSLDASVDICPSIIVPVTNDMKADTTSYVTSSFAINVTDLSQLVVEISIQPFMVRRLPGFVWSVDRAVFDFSDTYTPPSMQFPLKYDHPDVNARGVPGSLWQGFYMKSARVKLPDAITQSDTIDQFDIDMQTMETIDTQLINQKVRTGISIGVENLIIDYTGFSGAVFGTDLLALDEGRIGTWRMSVDSIAVVVKQNIPNGGAFEGKISIPMFDSTTLGYKAHIMPMTSQYLFEVSVEDQMVLKSPAMGGSSFIIEKNSSIKVEYTEKLGFIAKAVLNGTATFTPGVSSAAPSGANAATGGAAGTTGASQGQPKDSLVVHGITFEGLELSTKEPYLKPGIWSYSTNGKQDQLGDFPITINEIGFIKEQTTEEVGFVIDVDVNLMKDADNGFAAGGRVAILCNIDLVDGVQQWTFSRVRVERLSLDVSGPGYAFRGRIDFFENNPVYGTGMRGAIRATFQPSIDVGAVIQFGTVDGYRYWYADASVGFAPGIAIGASGLALYGFGGGAYYHMRREGFTSVTLPEATAATAKDSLGFDDIPSQLGQSMTGISYVPDKEIFIGVKAMVAIGTVVREAFNATLQFEISFLSSGGINQIGFLGDARFMTPPGPDQSPSLRCVLDMVYDFPNTSFHAQLDVYVSVAGGVIRGAYPKDRAGTGVIHADPDEWYIYLGTPDKRVRVAFDPKGMANLAGKKKGGETSAAQDSLIPDIGIMLTAYLDVGSKIPDFPEPFSHNPQIKAKVQSILGTIPKISRSNNPLLENGGGFIFGATLDVVMPELTFLIFYAEFAASLGFDIMLKDYGQDARCAGNEGSSEPIGINGWYATGQFFAYLGGAIGLKVDIFGIKGKFEILSLAAAAVLQARLPNPFWIGGKVGGRYNILGGLIKGNCSFEFEAGEVCDIVGASQLEGIEIVSSLAPDENSSNNVDVFIRPQVTFNLGIGEVFTLANGEGQDVHYKAKLIEYSITDMVTKQTIAGQIDWNYSNDLLAFKPDDILTGNRKHEMKVRVQFESKIEDGAWKVVLDSKGKPEQQERIIEFTTGPAPDYIPQNNIAYSYPVLNQYQFLKGETSTGYVQLKQGQPYLFAVDQSKWKTEAIYFQDNRPVSKLALNYNNQTRRVSFAIPASQLSANTVTQLSLARVPVSENTAIDANLNIVETNQLSASSASGGGATYGNDGEAVDPYSTLVVEERRLEGSIEALEVSDLLTMHFRTSHYSTFREKIQAADLSDSWYNPVWLDPTGASKLAMDNFGVHYDGQEIFDRFDLIGWHNGDELVKSLVYAEADLAVTGSNWYSQVIYPYMYRHLPSSQIGVTWRDPEILGDIPVFDAGIYQSGEPQVLSETEVLNRSLSPRNVRPAISYTVPYRMFKDYYQFKDKVRKYSATNQLSPGLRNFLDGNFTYPMNGQYKLKMHYRLPGNETPHSTVDILIPFSASSTSN